MTKQMEELIMWTEMAIELQELKDAHYIEMFINGWEKKAEMLTRLVKEKAEQCQLEMDNELTAFKRG